MLGSQGQDEGYRVEALVDHSSYRTQRKPWLKGLHVVIALSNGGASRLCACLAHSHPSNASTVPLRGDNARYLISLITKPLSPVSNPNAP